MTLVDELADLTAGLSIAELPDDIVHTVRRHLLDALGCALASAGAGVGTAVVDAVRAWGGVRESGVLGLDFRAPAAQAALAGGVLVHALDYDDTHMDSIVHAGAAVVPAALAVAEETGADGRTVVAGLAAGFEVACRMGAASAAAGLRGRGFDPTGIAGPFGAAAAAARIWGLTRDETVSALGVAGTLSGGLLAAQAGDSEVMRIRSGWASQTGVVAADLARRRFAGPAAIAEGPHSLFDAGAINADEWSMRRLAIKPYPACHFVHAYADAVARLGVKAGDVAEVICFVHPAVVPVVCEPRTAKAHPVTDTQARFSLPFAVATALVGGRAPLEMFGDDARSDRRILSLCERVVYEPDPSVAFPSAFGAKVIVTLRDGRTRTAEEPVNRGHPDRPLGDEDVRSKFIANARKRLDAAEAAKLADEVWRLPLLDDAEQLLSLATLT